MNSPSRFGGKRLRFGLAMALASLALCLIAPGRPRARPRSPARFDSLRPSPAPGGEESLEERAKRSARISHDIINGLTVVALYAQDLLRSERQLSMRARRQLTGIARATDEVSEIAARMHTLFPRVGASRRRSPPPELRTRHGPARQTSKLLRPFPGPLAILVIDDDPATLQWIAATLAADGHTIVTAGAGPVGIEHFRDRLRTRPFDLVLTELGMPRMDGREVAAAIKQLSASTPVIGLTHGSGRSLGSGARPPEVDLMLGKPLSAPVLRAAMVRLVRPSSPSEAESDGP